MLHSGQAGTVNDTTTVPFVTGVVPVEADGEVGYQPVLQYTDNGLVFTTQATLLQDGSCRLDVCQLNMSNILKTETYRLLEEEGFTETKKGNVTTITNGITVQVPTVQSFRVALPEVVIPEGMSLLVAFPGIPAVGYYYDAKGESRATFLLITPRAVR